MATSSVYEDLKDFVTCDICFEPYEGREPRTLPCVHSFCSPCIQEILTNTRKNSIKITDDIRCPVCKKPATIPDGDVSNLPAYFPSHKIQDILKQIKQKHSVCKICVGKTHKANVTSYCFKCTMAACKDCKSKHDRRHKNHAQVQVSASTIAFLVCPDHDTHVEAFCIDCSRAVCAVCSLSTHEDHTIKDLCSDEVERADDLDQLFADHMESADQQLARLITIQDDFNMHMDTAGDKLDRHHVDAIKQLKQQHQSFRAQLRKRRDKVNQNLEQSKTLIQQGNDCVNNLKRQSASWRRPIPGIPAASITDNQDLIEGIKQQLPSTEVPSEEPRRVVFLPSDLGSLGNIVEEELKPTTQLQRVIPDVHARWRERVTAKANTIQKDGTRPKKGLPVAKKNTEPNVTGRRSLMATSRNPSLLWDVEVYVCGIAILPGGSVICACGYDSLRVYDEKSGEKIQHPISDMCEGYIRGVSVCDDGNHVAAVEWREEGPGRVHIYTSVNGRWKHQMYNTCVWPQNVACTGDGHFIVGSHNNSIHKYNIHGHQIWEKKLSFRSHYISTDHKNRILVSNTNGGCVTVYNEDGVEMFSFPAATDQRKLTPRGVCVDDEDNILVVDEDSKSVLLYDPRGQFMKKLVDIVGEGYPDSVALYQDTHVAVYTSYGFLQGKLHLYQL